jgi:two-component system OmpR family response regulator
MVSTTEPSSTQGTAVVIEDDVDIRNIVCAVLRQAGYDVHSGATGREGVEVVRREAPAVVTLDIGLPDIDGYEVLRRIRHFSDCYVIVLTAHAEELDTLTALQCGADDYLTKPFRPRELRARINALMRRPRAATEHLPSTSSAAPLPSPVPVPAPAPGSASDGAPERSATLTHGNLVLDRDAHTAQVSQQDLLLTRSEFDLLLELLRSGGAVRTKTMLVGVLRGDQYRGYSHVSDADRRSVEVHIGNLRKKLAQHLGTTEVILTVRGVGYRIIPLTSQTPGLTASPREPVVGLRPGL